MSLPSRVLVLSPGRTGSQSLSVILARLAPSPGVVSVHEHPLSRLLIPLSHLHRPTATRLARHLVDFPSEAIQHIRIDPLLSHCASASFVRCKARLVFVTRRPSDWAESLARKIRHQKLYPLIRAFPVLRPEAPQALFRSLLMSFPRESQYLLGLLASYVRLHRIVADIDRQESILQLEYEQLYGKPGSCEWEGAWRQLCFALGWPTSIPFDQILTLQGRRRNNAPVFLRQSFLEPDAVDSEVQRLIIEGCTWH